MRGEWWKNGLQLNLRIEPIGLVLAVVYAFACWGARKLSLDQFYLPAGIRVAALLLCPPRLWPYLFLGEYAYFAQMRYPMVDKYGVTWVILASVSLMPTVAMIVRLHRKVVAATTQAWLLSVGAASAVAVTSLNLVLMHLLWPTPDVPLLTGAARYIVGDFIGILTVVPLALLWASRRTELTWTGRFLTPSIAALALMILTGMASALVPAESATVKTSLQLLMALPAIALTCLLGWRGAAIAVPSLNLIIGLTTPKPYPLAFDPTTFTTQMVMAIASVALLLFGSRITHYYHRYRIRDDGEKNALKLARNSHIASEKSLRERALHLRKLGDGIEISLKEVVNWLKSQGHHEIARGLLNTATVHSQQFRTQASMVYPTTLDQLGLYVALQAGGVRECWDQSNRVTRPRLEGDPCMLSTGLQLAAYRALIEAVSLLLEHEFGQVMVRARCGARASQRGILVVVALLDSTQPLSDTTIALVNEHLAGLPLAYGGVVQCRRNRIRMLLTETPTHSSNRATHYDSADSRTSDFGNSRALT
ncbi:MASE1 domain-containing protein [Stenotrophomonas sp. PUT21]|uniref:MASE1 domain-containing protein n=1 Tax=Stenotrophomonas TaxID=40323 RepID=UPI003B7D1994